MGLRIKTNVSSLTAQRHLSTNTRNLGESLEKLSSGHRLNKSSDDAAGFAIAENMRAKTRGLNQAKRNANDGLSMLQVAEGAMNEMSTMLVRMRELGVQASSDTFGDKDRAYLNREYVQLAKEIDRIAATTEFNDKKFFIEDENNKSGEYVIQVGVNNTTPEMNQDTLSINLQGLKFTSADLGIGQESEIGAKALGETAPTREAIAEKLGVIDSAIERIVSERATLGALQSRFDSTINNLSTSVENLTMAASRIKDVDYAEETANLAKHKILGQSNLSVLSQANQLPDMALALLR